MGVLRGEENVEEEAAVGVGSVRWPSHQHFHYVQSVLVISTEEEENLPTN